MNPGIFLIQDNEELVEMNDQPYDSEKLLQSWLVKYPASLVEKQIDNKEPRRWLFIEQECSVPSQEGGAGRWAIDHDPEITLKRWKASGLTILSGNKDYTNLLVNR